MDMNYSYEIQKDWENPSKKLILLTKGLGLILILIGVIITWNSIYSIEVTFSVFNGIILILSGMVLLFMSSRNFRPIIGNTVKYVKIDKEKITWRQGVLDIDKSIIRKDITKSYKRKGKVFFETDSGKINSIWLNQFQNKDKLKEFLNFYENELKF